MWFPIDYPLPTDHFAQRIVTEQATGPKSSDAHIPLSWRTRELKSVVSAPNGADKTSSTTYTKVFARNAGFALSPSSGLWFSALFNEELALVRTVSGSSGNSGAHEEFRIREVQARAGFELTSNVQLGFGIRTQSLRSEVSSGSGSSARTLHSGTRLGVVAGAIVGSPSLSLALNYRTPLTGKVNIEGESKLSAESGYLGAALKFTASGETALFANYGIYNASRNELASTNNDGVVPLGVSVDTKLVPTSVIGFGVEQNLNSSLALVCNLMQGKAYESTDPALLVPKNVDSNELQKTNTARVGVELKKSDYETQLFIDYSQLEFSKTRTSGRFERKSSGWGVGLKAGIALGS
jgi:hypothetical protein